MKRLLLAGLSLLAMSGQALAQPPATPAPAQNEVVVTAIRPNQVRELVQELGEPGKQEQMSRWDGRVCPGVVGVQSQAAQALIDQIARRAFSVGLDIGRPGCKANVLIVVTPDAQAFTPTFVDQNKKLFSYYEDQGNALGRDALMAFANTARPVRWWHVSQTVTDRGQVLGQSDARGGSGDFSGAQVARVGSASRVRSATRQEFNRVVIIVDAGAVAGKPFPAVADYVAMVSLAQIRAEANRAGLHSILNLFDSQAEGADPIPAGWTDWDEAYVEGLYKAPEFARNARQQQGAIVQNMERRREAAESAPVEPPPASPSTKP